MVAYSFQKRFRAPILDRTKQHTIRRERAGRSRHAGIGDQLQLYTGMRTRHCQIIARASCVRVEPIRLTLMLAGLVEMQSEQIISASKLDEFAASDGFDHWPDMVAFWRREHPTIAVFSGTLIGWGALQLPREEQNDG